MTQKYVQLQEQTDDPNWIPDDVYDVIKEKMVVPCVDIIVPSAEDPEKILLLYRIREPAKDYWWAPGGRMNKDDTSHHDAAKRLALRELGFEVEAKENGDIGHGVTYFEKSSTPGISTNTSNVYVVMDSITQEQAQEIKLQKGHEGDWQFMSHEEYSLQENQHDYMHKIYND